MCPAVIYVLLQSRIDLDQQMINDLVDEEIQAAFDSAYSIYTKGGHSKSVATLSVPGGLKASLTKDSKVVGQSTTGEQIVLTPSEDYASGATSVKLLYSTPNCYVGGLPEAEQNLDGCKWTVYSRCFGSPTSHRDLT
jgi:hypothetical protein